MNFKEQHLTPEVGSLPNSRQLSRTVVYENRTNRTIMVHNYGGEFVKVKPISEVVPKLEFCIYISYSLGTNIVLSGLSEILPEEEYNLIKKQFDDNRSACYRYTITDFEALDNGEGIYLPEVGLALTSGNVEGYNFPTVRHAGEMIDRFSALNVVGCIYAKPGELENERMFGRFLDNVIEMPVVITTVYETGIYLKVSGNTTEKIYSYKFDDPLSPVRVFLNRKTAEDYEPTTVSPEYIQMMKEKFAIEKVELEQQAARTKFDLEREQKALIDAQTNQQAEYAFELKKREAEMKLEADQLKQHYEEKSFKRKEVSELMKWLPAIITGAAALFSLLK